MSEAFLHYLWRLRLPGIPNPTTTDGRVVQILHIGHWNQNEGPDFLNARLRIGPLEWAGNVEIHVRSSQWQAHGHDNHPAYRNVILHVVYEDDAPLAPHLAVATIELRHQLPSHFYQRYQQLQSSTKWVPCASSLNHIVEPLRTSWLQRVVVERLEARLQPIKESLQLNRNDWQETFYQMLAGALGAPVNTEPMRQLAQRVPLKMLARHLGQPVQIEAMLFGTAGLLPRRSSDEYTSLLQQEFKHLQKKYGLPSLPPASWRFFRLRPAAFPTLRIAQLASLFQQQPALWSLVLDATTVMQLKELLKTSVAGYWQMHYRFGTISAPCAKTLGDETLNLLLINCIIPMLFLYGKTHGNEAWCQRALSFLEQLPAENNTIVRRWRQLGITPHSAADSQALMYLKHSYCDQRRCLFCAWGSFIIQGK
ncbi:MAG: DUF2851 family protein [Chitinophagales bacterium]|nr:DUF2851 family protein [Chitinophagales bacterium]MDW8427693.1 DUF2851 family protein [Chitinophagales bacterium]